MKPHLASSLIRLYIQMHLEGHATDNSLIGGLSTTERDFT